MLLTFVLQLHFMANDQKVQELKFINIREVIRQIPENEKTGPEFTNFYERMHYASNGYTHRTNLAQLRAFDKQIKKANKAYNEWMRQAKEEAKQREGGK